MPRFGLPERLLAILLLVAAIDFAANSLLFDRANNAALQRDTSARVAEHLMLASRALERAPVEERPVLARSLGSPRFALAWSPGSADAQVPVTDRQLRTRMIEVSPQLADANLQLTRVKGSDGEVIAGTLDVRGGGRLAFRTYASKAPPLGVGLVVTMLLPTVLLGALAWVLFRATTTPLRMLVEASRHVGSGSPREMPERGPAEVRQLIRAFDRMQRRIHRSQNERTQSMLAIGHDLRTPLARLQLRLDNAGLDGGTHGELQHDIEEMSNLLGSLQAFVDTGRPPLRAERIDLAVMAATLVDTAADHGGRASYHGPERLEVLARPISIRRAMSNLIENALHYAGNVRVTVRAEGWDAIIAVEDDGPGIPANRMDEVLQPFFRLDSARSRDTPGMGLGLPIVRLAVRQEGGALTLANRPEGGLSAIIRLPGAIA